MNNQDLIKHIPITYGITDTGTYRIFCGSRCEQTHDNSGNGIEVTAEQLKLLK